MEEKFAQSLFSRDNLIVQRCNSMDLTRSHEQSLSFESVKQTFEKLEPTVSFLRIVAIHVVRILLRFRTPVDTQ